MTGRIEVRRERAGVWVVTVPQWTDREGHTWSPVYFGAASYAVALDRMRQVLAWRSRWA